MVGVSVVNLIGFFPHPTVPSTMTIAATALGGRLAEPCGLVSGKIFPFPQMVLVSTLWHNPTSLSSHCDFTQTIVISL